MEHTSHQDNQIVNKQESLSDSIIAQSGFSHTLISSAFITSPPPLNSKQIIQLQRTIGNQATIRLIQSQNQQIQRISDEEAEQGLRAYRLHRGSYPSSLIRRVQQRLGVNITGVMNTETVHAIADWAQNEFVNSSSIGFESAERLLQFVATGVERNFEREEYIIGAERVARQWTSLGNASARASAFEPILNNRLRASRVPPLSAVATSDDLSPRVVAHFDESEWRLLITPQLLEHRTLPSNMVGTLYHEIRHAEQMWYIIRYYVQHNMPIDFQIPPNVIAAAEASPELTEREEYQARMFEHSWIENSPVRQGSQSHTMENRRQQDQALENYCDARNDGDEETMIAIGEAFNQHRGQYQSMWHEGDANMLGNIISSEYSDRNPTADSVDQDPCRILEERRQAP